MTAYYPSSVKTFTNRVDFTDTILAEHVNSLQDEVNSIEATLGTYIKTGSGWVGSFDQVTTNWNTLKDRLANIEYGINLVYGAKIPAGGTTGQILVKSSGSDYATAWATGDFLPSQSTHSGQYLTTNGSTASWATVDVLPSQSTHAGQYLTTDGSTASWTTITVPTTTPDSFSSFLLAGC